MDSSRILGIVLLVAGIAILFIGINASHSLADTVSNTFTGKFTEKTTWYLIGGGVAALIGLLMLLGAMGGKRA
jgi:hypothetical protein